MTRAAKNGATKNKAAKNESGGSKLTRVAALVDRLVSAKEIERAGAVTRGQIVAAEKELGTALPASYVAFVERCGAIGKMGEPDFNGWSRELRKIYAPADAARLTKDIRKTHGKAGRHASFVQRTFFCVRWEATSEVIGVDDEGRVRRLDSYRPGTMLRAVAQTFDDYMLAKLSEACDVGSLGEAQKEPDLVTDLEMMNPTDLKPLLKLRSLERLNIRGLGDGTLTAVLGSHPNLRELRIQYPSFDELPDALFLAPKLELLELQWGARGGWMRYKAASGLLKWFQETEIEPKTRALYMRLLIDDEEWIRKRASDDDLLNALDAPNDRVVQNALRSLAGRLTSPKKLKGARIAILGKSQANARTLASQLREAGATIDDTLTSETSYAMIAAHPKGEWVLAKKKKIQLVHEAHVRALLDEKGARFLAKERGETPERVRELLLSQDPANVELVTNMLKEGGVPDGVLEAMLFVVQNPKVTTKTRKTLEALASEKLPDFSRVVREVFTRTNIFQSGGTKLADRLVLLEKKSRGAISSKRLALDLLAAERTRDWSYGRGRALLFAFESGDEAFALQAIELARDRNGLKLDGLEGRIGAALDTTPGALVHAKGIERISMHGASLTRVPKVVAKLGYLRALNLAYNHLKELPEEIAALGKLEELDLSHNRISKFPDCLLSLSSLRVLRINQPDYQYTAPKPKLREIPDGIHKLTKLERLEIEGQELVAHSENVKRLVGRGIEVVT